MESVDRLDLFQVVRQMVGQNGRLDVLEVLCHARLGEGWTTLGEIVIDLQRMGKRPRRESVAQDLSKLIENEWVQSRLLTLDWYQYRLVEEKRGLLSALDAEADKQQRLQAVQAALALEAVTSPPDYWDSC